MFFADQGREQLRQMYFNAWRKHNQHAPLEPVEAQLLEVIVLHPEYHDMLGDPQRMLDKDWTPEGGAANPFLHMGLHLAIREQVATDRPAGIRAIHQLLVRRLGEVHAAEHQMIECLAEALWTAQRSGQPPNERAYLERLKKL